jgi:periplasmic protein CpxP/Spy
MKYLVIALALALSLTAAAAPKAARSSVQILVDKLDLSADQKTKVDPITDADAKQFQALKADTTLSAEDRKKKTAALRKDTDAKLKAVLTEDQWKKYQELKAEHKTSGGKKKQ